MYNCSCALFIVLVICTLYSVQYTPETLMMFLNVKQQWHILVHTALEEDSTVTIGRKTAK